MAMVQIELDDALVDVLRQLDKPIAQSAQELMVLELYRRHFISSGKAAQLLGMKRFDSIPWSGELGIPYYDMPEEEWAAEMRAIDATVRHYRSSLMPVP